MQQKPRIGYIVNFYDKGSIYAAIVTWVWNDDCINLTVFNSNGTITGYTSVMHGYGEHNWSMPELEI
jgi:hypothetical protein